MRKNETKTSVDLLTSALSAAILTYVWRMQDLYPILASFRLPILASACVIGLYLIDSDRRRKLVGARHPITTAACMIMALAVLSVPTSVYQGYSFWFIVDDLSKNFLLFVILAASIRTLEDVRRYAAVLLYGGAIYAFYVYKNVPVGIAGRLGDLVYYDANDLGMLLVSTIPIGLFFAIRGSSTLKRLAAGVTLTLFMLVIIKTGSRGAFLGLIGMAVYMVFAFNAIRRVWRIGIVTSGLIALLVVGGEQYWSLMSTLLNPTEDYNWSGEAESGRMDVWRRGMGYMLQNPVTGVGVSAFPIAEGTISELADRQEYGIGLKWSAAHNSFVQVGAELGVLGLAFFGLLLWRSYSTARSVASAGNARGSPPSDEVVLGQALAGTIVGYAVTGFFLSQAYAAYAFVIYALIVGLARASRAAPSSGEGRVRRRRPPQPILRQPTESLASLRSDV
ncbi:MAG: O-antigen ligase family protein [Dehalococcoidia bacterium]